MQITERSTLGRAFERRLRAALDRVVPPTPHFAGARYRSMILPGRSGRIWRLAPARWSGSRPSGSWRPAPPWRREAPTQPSGRNGPPPRSSPSVTSPSRSQAPAPSRNRVRGLPRASSPGRTTQPTRVAARQTPHYTRGGSAGGAMWRAWRPRSPTMVQGENMRIFSPVPTLGKTIIWRHMRFRLWPA